MNGTEQAAGLGANNTGALARFARGMAHKRYVVYLLRSDPWRETGGLERRVRDEISALGKRGASSICLFPFPTKKSPWLNDHLAQYWGAVVDGRFAGFWRAKEWPRVLGRLSAEYNCRPVGIQIHHLLGFDLEAVRRFCAECPLPIQLFLHDYYTVCPQYNLLKNGERYCGPAKPSEAKCADCASWTPEHHGRMRALLEDMGERLFVVAPSEPCLGIWLNAFGDFQKRTAVVPHLKPASRESLPERAADAGTIRIAFVGMPYRLKGWDAFVELARELAPADLGYEFLHFAKVNARLPFIRGVPVDYAVGGANAMVDALRREGADVAVLWSICPETYSYAQWECRAAGVWVVANSDGGNIAHVVATQGGGKVLPDARRLVEYFRDPAQVRRDLDGFRRSGIAACRMEPNDETAQQIDFSLATALPSRGGAPRRAWHVGGLYGLKRLKKWLKRA